MEYTFYKDILKRILATVQRLRLRVVPIEYTETAALCRFDLLPIGDTRVSDVLRYELDFKGVLGKKSSMDYSNGMINIIVPKPKPDIVNLKDILKSDAFYNSPGDLRVVVGEDQEGDIVVGDLIEWVHVLVAGKSGGGKSVCLHSTIISLLYGSDLENLRLVLMDFKGSEFTIYENLPCLLRPIVYDTQEALKTLDVLVIEMNRRYALLRQSGSRDIKAYNQKSWEKIPYIVVVIDEFASLILSVKDAEKDIILLAQKARAAGIHLIIATQKPSAKVLTPLIKTNIATRMAFAVPNHYDSLVILDENGAENLNGKGDMILKDDDGSYRIQGAYISDREIERFVSSLGCGYEIIEVVPEDGETVLQLAYTPEPVVDDEMVNLFSKLIRAATFCIKENRCSRWSIREYLKVGWPIVDGLISYMQDYEIIGTEKEGRNFPILVSLDEFKNNIDEYKNRFEEDYYGGQN